MRSFMFHRNIKKKFEFWTWRWSVDLDDACLKCCFCFCAPMGNVKLVLDQIPVLITTKKHFHRKKNFCAHQTCWLVSSMVDNSSHLMKNNAHTSKLIWCWRQKSTTLVIRWKDVPWDGNIHFLIPQTHQSIWKKKENCTTIIMERYHTFLMESCEISLVFFNLDYFRHFLHQNWAINVELWRFHHVSVPKTEGILEEFIFACRFFLNQRRQGNCNILVKNGR